MPIQRSLLLILKYTVMAYFFIDKGASFHNNGNQDRTFSRNENSKNHAEPGSQFNEERNSKPPNEFSFWQPIIDGKIIGAIGSLFSKDIKDESNRERMQREKLREIILMNELTEKMNDPVQLYALKKKSNNAPRFINQVIH